jgi:hypothetical protein
MRCFVNGKPQQWSKWLPQAEHWYNTAHHSALGKSPFQVLYGRNPRQLGICNTNDSGNADLDQWLRERAIVMPFIRQHLERAQQRMENQANKHRSEREFAVGDQVYLKLQPYVQTSVAPRASQKLGFRFFGPYLILQKVGNVAYKLQLPASARIHPVVHVSQLKKAIADPSAVSTDLPVMYTQMQVVQPSRICGSRMIRRGGKQIPQVQLEWEGISSSCTCWEPLFAVVAAYPDAPAWGQAAFSGEGNVTTPYLEDALKVARRAQRRQEIRAVHLAAMAQSK